MNKTSHQTKVMVIVTAVTLGFAMLGAGCAQGNGNGQGKKGAMQPGGAANGSMSAGQANSTQPGTDTWITTKVKAALATQEGVDNSAVHVETNNGVVTLTGTAASQASIQSMSAAASRVKGVNKVDTSGLMVQDSGASAAGNGQNMGAASQGSQSPVSDTWITTKVMAKLHTVDGLNNGDVSVKTTNGIVALTGHVDTQAQSDAAVKAAKSIKGVKEVQTSMLKVGQ